MQTTSVGKKASIKPSVKENQKGRGGILPPRAPPEHWGRSAPKPPEPLPPPAPPRSTSEYFWAYKGWGLWEPRKGVETQAF